MGSRSRRSAGALTARHLAACATATALVLAGLAGVPVSAAGVAAEEAAVSTTAPTTTVVAPGALTVDFLESGERLDAGESLRAGRYRLVMQGDGNLVEYGELGVYELPPRVYWQTRTAGNPGAHAVMQSDGNLVVRAADGRPLWNSRTAGFPGARAGLVSTGFFVLYAEGIGTPELPGGARPLSTGGGITYDWRLTAGGTMRSPDQLEALGPPFDLVMQGDGNLVLRTEVRRDGYPYDLLGYKPYWHSSTSGNPGAFAVLQDDGNLVVYSPTGRPLWSSGSQGQPGAHLDLQRDGNVVLYSRSGQVLWQTGTAGVDGPVLVK